MGLLHRTLEYGHLYPPACQGPFAKFLNLHPEVAKGFPISEKNAEQKIPLILIRVEQ